MTFAPRSVSRTLFAVMIGFGVVMGIVFPFFTRALIDVPKGQVYSVLFFSMCILAGLLVGVFNFAIFRLVVYKILHRMTLKLGEFRGKLVAFSADRTIGCTPEECHLMVDSRDTIGELAGEFNTLVDTIYKFVEFERITEGFLEKLKRTLKIDDIADIILTAFRNHFGGDGGFLLGLERGEMVLLKSWNTTVELDKLDTKQLFAYLTGNEPVVCRDILEGALALNIGIGTLAPRHVAFIPLTYQSNHVGLAVLLSREAFKLDFSAVESRNFISQATPFLDNGILMKRLELLAAVDELTGALNRRFGLKRLAEEFELSNRHAIPLALAMIDIDFFKKINDTHGHQAGDFVLRTLAETIRKNIRLSDFIVRYGGEEFIVAAPGASAVDCFKFMDRIRSLVTSLNVQYGSYDLKFAFSGGIAGFPSGNIRDLHSLIQVADEALYKAKEQGRNRLVIAS